MIRSSFMFGESVTICELTVFGRTFFGEAKRHWKDTNDIAIGERYAMGRALAQASKAILYDASYMVEEANYRRVNDISDHYGYSRITDMYQDMEFAREGLISELR